MCFFQIVCHHKIREIQLYELVYLKVIKIFFDFSSWNNMDQYKQLFLLRLKIISFSQMNIQSTILQKIRQVKKILQQNPNIKLVGICGIPGAGKSTISHMISQQIPDSCILPMDGFHKYRNQLDQEGHRRRGAPFTFDMEKFKQKIKQIKKLNLEQHQQVRYPDFDHKNKDPVQNALFIPGNTRVVFVEGIYTFDKNQQLNSSDIWDMKIWIETSLQSAIQRLSRRHVQSGIVKNLQQAMNRINTSDKLNAQYILQNCFDKNEKYFIISNS